MCDNMIIDQFYDPKVVASKVMIHDLIGSRKMMTHLIVLFRFV